MKDVVSYSIVVMGESLDVSCDGVVKTIDIYSVMAQVTVRVYVLREMDIPGDNITRHYTVVAQTEFQTSTIGSERHEPNDVMEMRAGDVFALGYLVNNPVPYTGVSRECTKERRCLWYTAHDAEQMRRESVNNTLLSLKVADDSADYPCRVYSVSVTLQGKYPEQYIIMAQSSPS